jgi:large subunit ribosomal protein L22
MDYTTIQKNIQNSPRKLRLVADMVRKMSPSEAVEVLQFTNQAAAVPLSKAIKTAMANAKKDDVIFKTIEINEGMKLKRYRAGTAGRGRGRPYKKRWSHIKIVLTDDVRPQVEDVKTSPAKAVQVKNEVKAQEKVEKTKVLKEKK